ncbi:MAG: NTE family protein rssA [Rhizobiales bacterium 65-9]|nr:patatin-like phospholipase family protein [Hyphomicrobiales bacterium]OJY33820.1 MAG: NTE family protein rssA [Rhizobiales bacterium 65-9]
MFFDAVTRRAFGMGGAGESAPVSGQPYPPKRRQPKIGIALGSGAARGWSHIGVLRALEAHGIPLHVIAGCSMGAVAGACWAAGKLDDLEEFARGLTRTRVVGLMDIQIAGSGLIAGNRLRRRLDKQIGDLTIEALPVAFAAVATELQTGHEVWLTRGRLVDAICASYALPGIFEAVNIGGRWLVDGALVNPVPVSAARALGADIVIAVNMNGDMATKGAVIYSHGTAPGDAPLPIEPEPTRSFRDQVMDAATRINPFHRRDSAAPSLAGVMIDAFNITQDRISRSRLAGDPPDFLIAPRVGGVGLFDFQRAAESIDAGREAAERVIEEIKLSIGQLAKTA